MVTVLQITNTFLSRPFSSISSKFISPDFILTLCRIISDSLEKSRNSYCSPWINPHFSMKYFRTGGKVAVIIANRPPISVICFSPVIIVAIICGSYDCTSSRMTLEYFKVAAKISVPNARYTNLKSWSTVHIVSGLDNNLAFSYL